MTTPLLTNRTQRGDLMNPVPVFQLSGWDNVGQGLWEVQAPVRAPGGRPPYEAITWTRRDLRDGWPCWDYALYQPVDGHLELITAGTAATLTEARRLAEAAARNHRDRPPDDAPTTDRSRRGPTEGEYDAYSIVICDNCGTNQQLGQVLFTNRCDGDGQRCTSTSFDGHDLDQLAQAVRL